MASPFGKTNKGEEVIIKTGKKTIVDDISSIGTLNEKSKLLTINNYTKTTLEEMAKENNIDIPPKATKNIIYAKLKESLTN